MDSFDMIKSDLRSGMLVTLRNGETYYVMLNTGLPGRMNDVLVHRVGDDTGWMTLRNYAEDMTHHDDPDDIFPATPEEDRMWDIVQVDACRFASDLCTRKHYRTIWKREEN